MVRPCSSTATCQGNCRFPSTWWTLSGVPDCIATVSTGQSSLKRVEDRFEEQLMGVTAVDDPQGWDAEEGLEQCALQIAMDFLMERYHQRPSDGPARLESGVP